MKHFLVICFSLLSLVSLSSCAGDNSSSQVPTEFLESIPDESHPTVDIVELNDEDEWKKHEPQVRAFIQFRGTDGTFDYKLGSIQYTELEGYYASWKDEGNDDIQISHLVELLGSTPDSMSNGYWAVNFDDGRGVISLSNYNNDAFALTSCYGEFKHTTYIEKPW